MDGGRGVRKFELDDFKFKHEEKFDSNSNSDFCVRIRTNFALKTSFKNILIGFRIFEKNSLKFVVLAMK